VVSVIHSGLISFNLRCRCANRANRSWPCSVDMSSVLRNSASDVCPKFNHSPGAQQGGSRIREAFVPPILFPVPVVRLSSGFGG
jgi:hypothetical protein